MIDSPLFPLAFVGTIFWALAFLFYIRRWTSQSASSGKVERERWEIYAGEHHYQYMPSLKTPRIRGVHRGVSFELSATVVKRRDRYGNQFESAVATLRATHRSALPHGFNVRRSSIGLTLGSMLLNRWAIDVDEAYDKLRAECDNEEAANKLLDDPGLRSAILSLYATLPRAVIHERAIETVLPPMPVDMAGLDTWLDLVADVATSLRRLSPQVERPTAEGAPVPLKPIPTAAELPERRENLSSALRKLGTASSKMSAGVQASAMKVRPYEYELEVRVVGPSESRLGLPTGGRLVRGQLSRSPWRMEIAFGPADNALVDALKPTDVITGMALVDDLRAISQTIECTAQTPPVIVESGKVKAPAGPDGTPTA